MRETQEHLPATDRCPSSDRPPSESSLRSACAAKKPAADGMRIMVRDLMLSAKIGLHQHERIAEQRIRVNLDLAIADLGAIDDDYDKVVCYGELVTGVRHVVGAGHVNLVETLAERIAAMCLADRRVLSARVRVEKLDVFPEASVGGCRDRAPPARRT